MALNNQFSLLLVMAMLASFVALSEQAAECPANSTMAECGNRCEPNCADPPGGKMCPAICGPTPACACQPGYARNSTGQCVSEANCPGGGQPPRVACNLLCKVGFVCVVRPVYCIRAPCPPRPQCVPAPAPRPPVPSAAAAEPSSESSSDD